MLQKMIVFSLLLLIFSAGCAQKTAFYSDPSGATVFVNGKAIGQTPCEFKYKSGTAKTYHVEVQANGYKPQEHDLVTDQTDSKARTKWLSAGLVWSPLFIGAAFTRKLSDAYHFFLTRTKAGPGENRRASLAASPTRNTLQN